MKYENELKYIIDFNSGGPSLNYDSVEKKFVFWTDALSGDKIIIASGTTLDDAIVNFIRDTGFCI